MNKSTSNTQEATKPLTLAPVPDAQAIPGIKGPENLAEVHKALKIKAYSDECIVDGTFTFKVGDETRTYRVKGRALTSESGSFLHLPQVAVLRDKSGKEIGDGMDVQAIAAYQDYKSVATGRTAAPVLQLPKEYADQMAQIKAQIIATLPKAQQDDIRSGKAYLNQKSNGFVVSYHRDRKAKKKVATQA